MSATSITSALMVAEPVGAVDMESVKLEVTGAEVPSWAV